MMAKWQPPAHWLRLATVDSHAGGEPFRVVTAGWPEMPGETMLARRRFAREHCEHLRRALMWEPRGHADMYGAVLTPPLSPEADLGVLFMHNEGYSTMCGHGVIALTTVLLETGRLPASEPQTTVRFDTPAGLVTARAAVAGGRVRTVRFVNVASFVLGLDLEVGVAGLGTVRYDLAYGGAFYAYVRAAEAGVGCRARDLRELIARGRAIRQAIAAAAPVEHPLEPELGFLYGVIFTEDSPRDGVDSRNVCVFADGEVDRSPTGTGVSGRLAIEHARGALEPGRPLVLESLVGSRFTGRILETARCGPHPAVIPEVEGTAHLTGRHEFWVDPNDPLAAGFLLR